MQCNNNTIFQHALFPLEVTKNKKNYSSPHSISTRLYRLEMAEHNKVRFIVGLFKISCAKTSANDAKQHWLADQKHPLNNEFTHFQIKVTRNQTGAQLARVPRRVTVVRSNIFILP